MKIAIGNDHAGTEYKFAITEYLESEGIEVTNYGTNENNSVDYPDFVHPVAKDVNTEKASFGILVCGSGNGVAMTANKYKNVRAGLCWTKEITELTRLHNDANIICIPARFTSLHQAVEMVKTFLSTEFEGGRHLNRVQKIPMCI
ncbi:ribose 5-phosphate isomerase B [Aquimarina sp. MAR_2010_214]|uniref:ribose 5-phosphate isomerase B n=1 Tax=Aquimarina sp. MAR_2010_214 TaxID=1250026 RepID=UPI000C713774|nr:ribose 5-phosphate isomerase B [Aquimarina sp. MAR_2010_214]PKV48726.1 ribose 5-phosphate isomerase B [Aquimarina sp. MAR_2010_214]